VGVFDRGDLPHDPSLPGAQRVDAETWIVMEVRAVALSLRSV